MSKIKKIVVLILLFFAKLSAEIESARTIEEAFKGGKIGGHVGLFAQQSLNKEPGFLDINSSFAYSTLRYKGYKIGTEFWLNAKLFEAKPGDFSRNKDIFVITNLYADFYNQYEKFGIRAGRYQIDEEWITHNAEGFSVDYDGIENVSLNFSWVFRNAYTENYYTSGFRRMYRVIGAMLLRGSIQLPQFPISITPYMYFAPGVFFSPAVKANMNLPLPKDVFLKSNMHFLTYVQDKGYYGSDAGTGVLFMLDTSASWYGIEGGVGFSITSEKGASLIDAFGQHTAFERPVGMFYGGAITAYSFLKYSLPYLDVYGAIRETFLENKNIFNWEVRISGTPLKNISGLELGFSAIGLDNPTSAVDYFGGSEYILFRGYVQYKF
ncbi:outer membrane family protein [Helicobacter anatolicus]|uniref:outer membrane family protein n=1 Tax=Helicobacter anatolicus TaxID=2905874 RepID=UPI001E4959FA|nr:outer membrane family protein [Helicobacter anatolicus]MCE3037949.1 outer membrane family protein [Helicobacter anatolicus]